MTRDRGEVPAEQRIPLQILGLGVSIAERSLFSALNLRVLQQESVAVIGESGAGKTTLLNTILGTVRPDAGSIVVDGQEVVGLKHARLARLRADSIGIVFQHGELLGELTPVENVALPALIAGRPRESAVARASSLLDILGVPLDREMSDQLSGGERQRTALARALINEPALLLADEPTGSLDADTRDRVADVLFEAPQRWGCGLVVVTHDRDVAARADRQVTLSTFSPAHVT